MIDLYTSPTPNGWKASIMIEEIGVPYTVKPIRLEKLEQKQEWYLELNPNGRIPTIVDHVAGIPACRGGWQYDNMMPAAQTQRFANVLGTDDVQINYIPSAGHFGHTDQPKYVADTLVNFFRRVVGRGGLADVNLGNEGIWKGDEREMIQDIRALFGIDARSRL